ncbi:MAG: glycosyltransferase [Hydrogenibacillus schlegelii]|nr:glycosyltransferase [Hydrogenibacillus schlegelii]
MTGSERPLGVLIISYLFPPVGGGGVPRAQKLVKYLPDFGIRPVVLAACPPPYLQRDESRLKDLPRHVPIYRVPHPRWHLALSGLFRGGAGGKAAPGDRPEGSAPEGASGGKPEGRTPPGTGRPAEAAPADGSAGPALPRFIRRWLRSAALSLREGLFIPDEEIVWARRAVRAGLSAVRTHRVDVLFSTSGPVTNHLVALLIRRKTGLPWVADFRDPWTDNMHFTALPWRAALERAMERAVFRAASRVTTVTQAFREGFLARYPDAAIDVIYNGFDPEDVLRLRAEAGDLRPPDGVLRFAHAGIFYPKRHPRAFFQALHDLIADGRLRPEEVRLDFAGQFDPPGRDDNRRAAEALGLGDLVVDHGPLPYGTALRLLAASTVLLLVGDLDLRAGQYIPGKLFDYLAVGRPILALLRPGEAEAIVRRLPGAYVAPPDDGAAIRAVLERLVDDWRAGRLAAGIDVLREPAFEPYRRDRQAAAFAALFRQVVSEASSRS